MHIIKCNGFMYECRFEDKVLFSGKRKETIAFCLWNYSIPICESSKALDLLDNRASKIFFKDNKIVLDEPLDIA